jgi:hypothetical protein
VLCGICSALFLLCSTLLMLRVQPRLQPPQVRCSALARAGICRVWTRAVCSTGAHGRECSSLASCLGCCCVCKFLC